MPVKYETSEMVGKKLVVFQLHEDGKFTVDGVERPWFKTSLMPSAKPWMPAKRKSFRSLVKMAIRDGEYDEPTK